VPAPTPLLPKPSKPVGIGGLKSILKSVISVEDRTSRENLDQWAQKTALTPAPLLHSTHEPAGASTARVSFTKHQEGPILFPVDVEDDGSVLSSTEESSSDSSPSSASGGERGYEVADGQEVTIRLGEPEEGLFSSAIVVDKSLQQSTALDPVSGIAGTWASANVLSRETAGSSETVRQSNKARQLAAISASNNGRKGSVDRSSSYSTNRGTSGEILDDDDGSLDGNCDDDFIGSCMNRRKGLRFIFFFSRCFVFFLCDFFLFFLFRSGCSYLF
jgi:hypothetical protein